MLLRLAGWGFCIIGGQLWPLRFDESTLHDHDAVLHVGDGLHQLGEFLGGCAAEHREDGGAGIGVIDAFLRGQNVRQSAVKGLARIVGQG